MEGDENQNFRKQISDHQVPKPDPEETYRYYNSEEQEFKNQDIMTLEDKKIQIVDVWNDNYVQELEKIIDLTQKYNIISIDTEFPGMCTPSNKTQFQTEEEHEYNMIRDNVRMTKLIQIGISIADEKGRIPVPVSTWQFNFKFDKERDMILRSSLELLEKAGIDFKRFNEQGIDIHAFAEHLMVSGLVLNDEIKWVAFHGGHDFSYLIKMLLNDDTPDKSDSFYQQMKLYFPNVYDIKFIINHNERIRDYGLSRLATELRLKRIGPQHQAGSDSLMTLQVFFKLRDEFLRDRQDQITKSNSIIYGIGRGYLNSNRGFNSQQSDDQYHGMNEMMNPNNYFIYGNFPSHYQF